LKQQSMSVLVFLAPALLDRKLFETDGNCPIGHIAAHSLFHVISLSASQNLSNPNIFSIVCMLGSIHPCGHLLSAFLPLALLLRCWRHSRLTSGGMSPVIYTQARPLADRAYRTLMSTVWCGLLPRGRTVPCCLVRRSTRRVMLTFTCSTYHHSLLR